MSDRVLVTGADGFTGRALAAALRSEGVEVHVTTRHPDETRSTHSGDITDRDFVGAVLKDVKPAVVVHLAAISSPVHENVVDMYATNVVGAANVFDGAARHFQTPPRVVFSSSATVYNLAEAGDSAIDEDHPTKPTTHYGSSKLAAEQAADIFGRDVPITITRPFNYTGPGQSPNFFVPKMVDHFARRAPTVKVGNLDLYRDFSDVATIVEMYKKIVLSPSEPGWFNLCSGRSIRLREIVSMLETITGHRIEVVPDPALSRGGEPPKVVGSCKRLERSYGAFVHVPFEDTLARMLRARAETL